MPRHKDRPAVPRLGHVADALEGVLAGLRGADRVQVFLKTFMRYVKGEKAGKPFLLADWQRDEIVDPLYDTLRPDRLRRYRQAIFPSPENPARAH